MFVEESVVVDRGNRFNDHPATIGSWDFGDLLEIGRMQDLLSRVHECSAGLTDVVIKIWPQVTVIEDAAQIFNT